jgi:thiol-disulfide isomerase/thioredoxin
MLLNMKRLLFWGIALALLALIVYKYRTPRFRAGEQAPAFTTQLADGSQVALSDLKGKYVLLQFWGSWCGPCRQENPHLVELYQKYHPNGFEIFSIGIERNPDAWQKAIQRDGMVWKYHSTDLQEFDGPIARLFNVRSIPTTFLINPEGSIMGVSLSPEEIDARLRAALTN